jgi:hypothetical protein
MTYWCGRVQRLASRGLADGEGQWHAQAPAEGQGVLCPVMTAQQCMSNCCPNCNIIALQLVT